MARGLWAMAALVALAACQPPGVAGRADSTPPQAGSPGSFGDDAGSSSDGTDAGATVEAPDAGSTQPSVNTVAVENALPGDSDWQVTWSAGPHVLEGYAGQTSVNHGERVDLHLSADGAHAVHWDLYRLGYYQGAGARRVAQGDAQVQREPLPAPDRTTGRVECQWPATFTIATDPSWTSGIYIVKLTRDDGPQQLVPFVVRADEHKGAAVFQSSVTTWQAYNDWGGESLYEDHLGLSGGHATEASFNRPYNDGWGAGQLFRYEYPFLLWAESRGYDLTYVTDVDLDRDPSLLVGQKLFMSVGHDEYWSRPQREGLEAALGAGVSVAFFSANSIYWQIRLEPSRVDATKRRTEVCYKDAATDPHAPGPDTTVQWREPPVNEPEEALLGVMYDAWELADSAWVVSDASHWLYANTGVQDGDSIPLIVGYEVDRTWNDGRAPSNVQVVASAPVLNHEGAPSSHEATVYTAPSGATVFASGTIEWAWGLSEPGVADQRVQVMTDNVLEHAGLQPALPGDSFGAGTWSRGDDSAATGSVTTLAGAPFQTGHVDGPASSARFDRPVGAAVDAQGNLYVADSGNCVLRKIANDAPHTVSTLLGDGTCGTVGANGLELFDPTDVAVGPDGAVYVADTFNQRIVKLPPEGQATVFAGSPVGEAGDVDGPGTAARFANPSGLAFVGTDLYVADTDNSLIRKIDAAGKVTTVAGSTAGLLDGAGRAAQLYRPVGLAAGDGALWVMDVSNRLLRRIALDGSYAVTTVAGVWGGGFADGPAASAELMPWYGLFEQGGTLYFADTGNQRLRLLQGGAVKTFAGSGALADVDGPAPTAAFALPTALVPLPDGRMVVVDNGASTIRVVDRGH